jgi:RNA polymerase sigma-70 factor (ECF subfamily)
MARPKLELPLPFEQIMRRHERDIMRFLLRALGDRDDAADLFQETWLRAYRAYPRLAADREVRSLLYAIAVNLCRNRARDGARRRRVIVADDQQDSAAERAGKTHRSHNENEGYATVRLGELISALPERQREALQLRYFAGLDYPEIAKIMKCSQPAARVALVFSCSAPSAARPADVARILKINDNTQTHELGNKLMVAVSEACNAGVSRIVVQRAATGKSLKWAPAREIDTSVAAN